VIKMGNSREILLEGYQIPIPEELKPIMKPGTKVLVRVERFGMIVSPVTDPIEDLIGCVRLKKPVNIEKQLDERFEDETEIY
jgi:hypothetical protein